MKQKTLAIEMIPSFCAAQCTSCPKGREKPIKEGVLETMANTAYAITQKVSDKVHLVVSINTPHHQIENLRPLEALLVKTNTLMVTFGSGLHDGLQAHGGGDIQKAARNFVERIHRDLNEVSHTPDRLTIAVHINHDESYDDLILLEAYMIHYLIQNGLIGTEQKSLKKVNFHVTKNDTTRKEVNKRYREMENKFMNWHKSEENRRYELGPLFDLIGKVIFSGGFKFGAGPLFVGVNQMSLGNKLGGGKNFYCLNRGDSLSILQGGKLISVLEWDYRFLHHRGKFGRGETAEKTLHEKIIYDYTLMPGEIHYGHSAVNMLRPELRFTQAEFEELLTKGGNIVTLTKQAVRNRLRK